MKAGHLNRLIIEHKRYLEDIVNGEDNIAQEDAATGDKQNNIN